MTRRRGFSNAEFSPGRGVGVRELPSSRATRARTHRTAHTRRTRCSTGTACVLGGFVADWQCGDERSAACGGACDLERAAERLDAIAETDEAGTSPTVGAAGAVVAYRQHESVSFGREYNIDTRRV